MVRCTFPKPPLEDVRICSIHARGPHPLSNSVVKATTTMSTLRGYWVLQLLCLSVHVSKRLSAKTTNVLSGSVRAALCTLTHLHKQKFTLSYTTCGCWHESRPGPSSQWVKQDGTTQVSFQVKASSAEVLSSQILKNYQWDHRGGCLTTRGLRAFWALLETHYGQ